jgi:hypothetical protein
MTTTIQTMNSNVRAVDNNSLLTPEVMQQIVRMVLQAVDDHLHEQHRERTDRRVTPGVVYEMEHEER